VQHYYQEKQLGENWFSYAPLYAHMVQRFPSSSRFVELGSWKGKSAAFMGVEIINSKKTITMSCVDLWSNTLRVYPKQTLYGDALYQLFLANISPVAEVIRVLRADTARAADVFPDKSVQFVFIDADHSYKGCHRDISAWLPKVADGGILAGHDYAWTTGIRSAMEDLCGDENFSDPWSTGCFIAEIHDGRAKKFTLGVDTSTNP
jgi:hypothetical protein